MLKDSNMNKYSEDSIYTLSKLEKKFFCLQPKKTFYNCSFIIYLYH